MGTGSICPVGVIELRDFLFVIGNVWLGFARGSVVRAMGFEKRVFCVNRMFGDIVLTG